MSQTETSPIGHQISPVSNFLITLTNWIFSAVCTLLAKVSGVSVSRTSTTVWLIILPLSYSLLI